MIYFILISIDNSLISSSSIEEEVTTYPNIGVKVTKDETNKIKAERIIERILYIMKVVKLEGTSLRR